MRAKRQRRAPDFPIDTTRQIAGREGALTEAMPIPMPP